MSFVDGSLLKAPCPCGDDRCKAFGPPMRATGHSKKCFDGCPTCARPRAGQPKRHKIPDPVRRDVRTRSGGRCEVITEHGERCEFDAQHMHHKRRRSQGGRDVASNLLDCCMEHHAIIHAHPAWAMELGYLIGNEPISSAVTKVERRNGPPRCLP